MLHFLHMLKRLVRFAIVSAGALLVAAPVLAHEKWYADPAVQGPIPEIFRTVTPFGAAVVAFAALVFVAAFYLDRRHDGSKTAKRLDAFLLKLRLNPKLLLGALIGVSLLGAGLHHTLFSPNLLLPGDAYGAFLSIMQMMIGIMMLFFEPIIAELAVAFLVLFLLGAPVMPFWDMMEELLLAGAALFLITNETRRLPWKRWNGPEVQRLGYQAFRVLTGANFLVLAFVKWLRPDLGIRIVEQYHLNFMGWAGFDAAAFVFCAAVVETLVAICLLFRVAYRPAIMTAFLAFTFSIFALDYKELLGHLPIKGALLLFFVYGHWHKGESKEEKA